MKRFLLLSILSIACIYSSQAQTDRFLVTIHTDGHICDLEAIGGVEALKQAALATMWKSPIWEPANQGGRQVTCYKKQSIVFRLSDQ